MSCPSNDALPPRSARLAGAPPGPRQREGRLSALLDAAAALFVEKSVAATSIDDIAERAGVAKGTFYHYFRDRAAMLEALRRRYSQHFDEVVTAAMAARPADDWNGRLAAWAEATTRQYLATYALHDAIFHDLAVCQRCAISEEGFVIALAELMNQGAAAGVWTVAQPLTAAAFVFHGLHGLLDEAIVTDSDAAVLAPQVVILCERFLRR